MSKDRLFAIIILNYMSFEDTINELECLKKLTGIEMCKVFVIDNASENDSVTQLSMYFEREHTFEHELISNTFNAGYAIGNNIGLRKALSDGFKYALILNNDILFPDDNLLKVLKKVADSDKNIGCCSPRIYSLNGKEMHQHLLRPSFLDLSFGRISYRLRENNLESRNASRRGIVENYRSQGCCMVVDLVKIEKVGFLDESTFLYYEEAILAEKLIEKGWKAVLALDTCVIHNHSNTVKSVAVKKQIVKWVCDSARIYYRKFRRFNNFQVQLCLLFDLIREYLFV